MNIVPVCRRALPQEAAALTRIALAAKQSWGYPDEWMAEWRADLTIAPGYIGSSPVWVAEVDGTVVGFLGLVQEGGRWWLEHLWILPAWHGRGLGRALFAEAVRQARAVGATALLIKSDPNAEPFYLKMGATRTGLEVYDLPGKIRREVPQLSYRL
ncbi:MAG: GNAT family N-acetyltransferase [Opitutae bacterium]|nr:GNAT family N-acetyltransferase [Opitutae bacterium]